MYWDDDGGGWQHMDEPHGISAVPVDWDADGDLDLVLGTSGGEILLRLNEGTKEEPAWATTVVTVAEKDGRPLDVPGGESMPEIADWNGDGLFDILAGGGEGGAVWYRNVGREKEPLFVKGGILFRPPKGSAGTEAIGSRTQVLAADWDRDGDLDLLVGDYHSTPWEEGKSPEMHGFVWLLRRN